MGEDFAGELLTDAAEEVLRSVRPGEARGLVSVFRQAESAAEQIRVALVTEGVTDRVVLAITASLTDAGEPAVHLLLTPLGAAALRSMIERGALRPFGDGGCDPPGPDTRVA